MDKQKLDEQITLLGLKSYHLQDVEVNSTDDLIKHITESGILYRTFIQHLTLINLRKHLTESNIQPEDRLVDYFPKKYRKNSWNSFRENFPLKAPGLKLTRFAQVLLALSIIGFIYLNYLIFTEGLEIILAIKLAGLSLYPVFVLLFVTLGVIMTFGANRLPAKTVNDLMDQVVSLNHINLLSHNKVALKTLLTQELDEEGAHNMS